MHALWSGAPPRCRSYARVSKHLGRIHRTSATGPLGRRVTFLDVFTACYTTVLGAAAVFDAQNKDESRRALEQEIAEAKAELAQLLAEGAIHDLYYDEHTERAAVKKKERSLGDHLAQICIKPARLKKARMAARSRRNFILEHLGQSSTTWRWIDKERVHVPYLTAVSDALRAEENDPNLKTRECLTDVHLDHARAETVLLAEGLLTAALEMTAYEAASQSETVHEIKRIRDERYPHFKFASDRLENTREIRKKQCDLTRSILSNANLNGDFEAVAKIVYNLLVSPYPPSIQVYNNLLYEFHRRRWHIMAEVVVQSLYRTRLRPTQQTTVCLLHHYRGRNDLEGFYKLIARLVAVLPEGLRVRRRAWDSMSMRCWRLWALYSDVAAHPLHITERVPRDRLTYEAIILGLVHFGQLGHAIHVFSNALAQGCQLSQDGILMLLNQCIISTDRTGALMLVRVLSGLHEQVVATGISEMKKLSEKLYLILALIGLKPDTLQDHNMLAKLGIEPSGFRQLSIALFVNEATRVVLRVERATRDLIECQENVASGRHNTNDIYNRLYGQLSSRAGQWCEDKYRYYRLYGGLLDEIHKACQSTFNLAKAFRWILPKLMVAEGDRKQVNALVYSRGNPLDLLYDGTVQRLKMIIWERSRHLERESGESEEFEKAPKGSEGFPAPGGGVSYEAGYFLSETDQSGDENVEGSCGGSRERDSTMYECRHVDPTAVCLSDTPQDTPRMDKQEM